MPSRANTSATSALDSGSSGARIRSATSSTVTRTPNRENACAISAPIAPPPITISDAGQVAPAARRRGWSSTACPRGPSIGGADGLGAGVEHDAPASRRTSSPSTSHGARAGEPGGTAHERDARVDEPVDGDLVVPVGRSPRRGSGRAPATSPGVTVLAPARSGDPPGLGEHVGGADHHLARDAAVVGALAARPAGGRPRRPSRPACASWVGQPTPHPGRARRRRRPPARSPKSWAPACQPRQAPGS